MFSFYYIVFMSYSGDRHHVMHPFLVITVSYKYDFMYVLQFHLHFKLMFRILSQGKELLFFEM